MKISLELGSGRKAGPSHSTGSDRFAVAAAIHAGTPCLGRCPLDAGADEDCGGNSAIFDRSVLDDLASMLDDSELDAYLALLEPTLAPRIEKLAYDLEAGNLGGLLETAHALAGGAACYGLIALSESARVIERTARAAKVEGLPHAVSAATALVCSSLAAVSRWRCRFGCDRAAVATGTVRPDGGGLMGAA